MSGSVALCRFLHDLTDAKSSSEQDRKCMEVCDIATSIPVQLSLPLVAQASPRPPHSKVQKQGFIPLSLFQTLGTTHSYCSWDGEIII
jgi:hypothetical protein